MRHIILTAALIAATITSAFAGGRPTKEENDAAMKAGHTLLVSKTAVLETKVKNHDAQGAESVAEEVLTLMRQGMTQTMAKINLGPRDQQQAGSSQYNAIEKIVHEYTLLSKNVAANSQQLIEHAHTFLKQY